MRKVFFIWVVLLLAGVNTAYGQDVKTVVDSVKSNVKDSRMLQVLHKRIPPASIRIIWSYRTIDYENKINFKTALAACDIPVVLSPLPYDTYV